MTIRIKIITKILVVVIEIKLNRISTDSFKKNKIKKNNLKK